MQAQAYIKNIKVSPRKLRFLLSSIKKLGPSKSLDFLYYCPVKGAKVFYQAIKSAILNAKVVLKTNEDMLKFNVLTVEEGPKLKRYNAGGRGTAKPFVHRSSHLKIVLTSKEIKKAVDKPKIEVKKNIKSK